MKRTLVTIWLLLCLTPCIYGATSTLTGTLKDAQGNPVNGRLTMQLPVPAVDTATNTNVPATLVSYSVLNGAIQSGPPLYDVAGLSPANLYYVTKVYDSANNLIETGYFVVTGATFNLGAAVPTTVTTSNISYVAPAQAGTCPVNQFVTSLSATGPPSCAQPSAAGLSNGVSGTGAVALVSNPTLTSPIIGFAGTSVTNFIGTSTLDVTQTAAAINISSLTLATPNGTQRFLLWFEVQQSAATAGCTTQPTVQVSASWTEVVGALTFSVNIPVQLTTLGSATYATTQSFSATINTVSTLWESLPLIFTAQNAVAFSATYGAGAGCTTGATYKVTAYLQTFS